MSLTYLTALPVYNEAIHVDQVLDLVLEHCPDVLVVDDGSSDGTAERLARRSDVQVATHATNRGYGAALLTAFEYAIAGDFDIVTTIGPDQIAQRLPADRRISPQQPLHHRILATPPSPVHPATVRPPPTPAKSS